MLFPDRSIVFLLGVFLFEERTQKIFGGFGDVGSCGEGEEEGAGGGEGLAGAAGVDAADSGGTGEFDEVVEVFVPGELFGFLFEGGGDALNVEEGAGVGVGEGAFAGDAGGEVVDTFPDEGDAGEVAEEGGGAVFAEFFLGVVVFVVVVSVSGVPEGVDEPADEGGGDAEGEPALDGGDAVTRAAAFPLGDDEAEFVDLFASHDVGEAGKEAACGLPDAFLRFGEGLGSEFEGVADLPEGGG